MFFLFFSLLDSPKRKKSDDFDSTQLIKNLNKAKAIVFDQREPPTLSIITDEEVRAIVEHNFEMAQEKNNMDIYPSTRSINEQMRRNYAMIPLGACETEIYSELLKVTCTVFDHNQPFKLNDLLQKPVAETCHDTRNTYWEYGLSSFEKASTYNLSADNEELWTQKPYPLTVTQKEILVNTKAMLTDEIINAALVLIKLQFPQCSGLIPLQHFHGIFSQKRSPYLNLQISRWGVFAQIINIGTHFVSVCGTFSKKKIDLFVFDSLNPKEPSENLKNAISGVFKSH